MLVLGIETSCDETASALVEGGRVIRANVVATQDELHEEYGGVVPEIASRAHAEKLLPVIRLALAEAGATLADVDAVAVGHRPGLIGSLLVGVSSAKALSWALGRPLIGVDHVHAHLYAGCLVDRGESPVSHMPVFPALGLVVSGGHTSLYLLESAVDIYRLGGTIDDAVGEAFDKVAAILGLGYPGGPNVDRLAGEPGADAYAHDFPVSRLGPDSLDFSFSGLKTAVLYAARGRPGPGGVFEREASALSPDMKRDIAASFQRAAVEAVMRKLTQTHDHLRDRGQQPRSLLVGGGVVANSCLRSCLTDFASRLELDLRLPRLRLCVDNAAMIAGLGGAMLAAGQWSDLSLQAVPTTAC